MAVRGLVGAVQPFDHLFEWAVLCRNSIVVGKPNDLGDLEGEVFPKLLCEFHCGEGTGTVTVSDELKVSRQLCKSLESHTRRKDTGTDATVIGYLVTDNGTGCGIHNKPDIVFYAADFYVGFIGRGNGNHQKPTV